MMIEVGVVCLKNTGREAGRYCIVLKKINNSFVNVTGPKLLTGIKKRRCNVDHLTPTEHKIEIKEDSSDEEIIAALEKQNIITKLKLKKPSAAQMKSEAAKRAKPEQKETKKEAANETKKDSTKEKSK